MAVRGTGPGTGTATLVRRLALDTVQAAEVLAGEGGLMVPGVCGEGPTGSVCNRQAKKGARARWGPSVLQELLDRGRDSGP